MLNLYFPIFKSLAQANRLTPNSQLCRFLDRRFLSTSPSKCSSHFEPYRLSPLDFILPPIHMTLFLSFKLEKPARAVPVLEAGIQKLTSHLPFLMGNVVGSSLRGKEDPLRVEPPSATILDQYPMLKVKHHPGRYLSSSPNQLPTKTISYDGLFTEEYIPLPLEISLAEESPILRFQVNVLEDGVILSSTLHHRDMDGVGILNVLDALSVCCQNLDSNVLPQMLFTDPTKQALARKRIFDIGSAVETTVIENNKEMTTWQAPAPSVEAPISQRLVLCDSKIAQLKRMCLESIDVPTILSRNDIVSAVIWLCVMRANASISPWKTEGKSRLVNVTNIRSILRPPLPRSYMGNSILISSVESPFPTDAALKGLRGLLDNRPSMCGRDSYVNETDVTFVARLALAIRQGLGSLDHEHVQRSISGIMGAGDWDPGEGLLGEVIMSSLRKMGFYDLDFGPVLGKICDFDNPDARLNGVVWVLPARFENCPWEVRVTLGQTAMKLLRRDPLFRWIELNEGE